jgi:hypothetical protein
MKTFVHVLIFTVLMASCKKEINTSSPSNINLASNLKAESSCPIDASNYSSSITNSYFPLVPGTVFHYVNRIIEDGDTSYEQIEVSVSTATKLIAGVQCREVHDLVTVNGEVTEDTYDWYAQDNGGNVWYFGEHSKSMKDKSGSTTEGSWKAGEQNACRALLCGQTRNSMQGRHITRNFYQVLLKTRRR